jgi:hypothetical protein
LGAQRHWRMEDDRPLPATISRNTH